MAAGRRASAKMKWGLGACATALVLLVGAGLSGRQTPAPVAASGEKFALRVAGDTTAVPGQSYAYAPGQLADLASVKSFTPVPAWKDPAPAPAAPVKFAAPVAPKIVLPPRRPLALKPAPDAPRVEPVQTVAAPQPARIAGMELPRFVPTGDDIKKGVSNVGDTIAGVGGKILGAGADVGEKIADVGQSLGRLMRISNR